MIDENLATLRALTAAVPGRLAALAPRITVVGDVMLDGWWAGTIERMCREAPAPIVDLERRDFAPGGAANTAMNLAAMGARVKISGLVGVDEAGATLRSLLEAGGVDTTGLVEHPDVRTVTKYRILSGDQVMLRLDDGGKAHFPADALAALARAAHRACNGADAVVVCDYGSGALTGETADVLRTALADEGGTPLIVVDAHDPGLWAQLSPHLVTPNAKEAAAALTLPPSALSEAGRRAEVFREHADELLEATGADAAVVTLDREGTLLLGRGGATHRTWARPATEKQASGAGDTFVAALTLSRACGLPLTTSIDLAQAAADVVVHRFGTSVCSTRDLAAHLDSFADTAVGQEELVQLVAAERAAGRSVALTNGCFDVLHRGHTSYLNQAKQLADILIVAVNGDDSVRRLKGPGRPINNAADRAGVLAALSCVDYVTVFDTDTPIPLLQELKPDIYAKGGDYTPEMLEETAVVRAYGGEVRILDYVAERSTTAVVEKIRGGHGVADMQAEAAAPAIPEAATPAAGDLP